MTHRHVKMELLELELDRMYNEFKDDEGEGQWERGWLSAVKCMQQMLKSIPFDFDTTEFRAAYGGNCRLTGPEHAHLPDTELLAEAICWATEHDQIGDAPHQFNVDWIRIGLWIERY